MIRLFFRIKLFSLYKNYRPKIQYNKYYRVRFLIRHKNINSSLIAIGILVKSNIGKRCLINFLMNIPAQALGNYLRLANIYKSNSSKRETNLVEMIVYGCITNKINKNEIEDISPKETHKILKEYEIILKSLPGYGNSELKRHDMKPCDNDVDDELCIKVEA